MNPYGYLTIHHKTFAVGQRTVKTTKVLPYTVLTSILSLKRNIVIGSPLLVLLLGSAPMSITSNFLMKLLVEDRIFA